jgi:hypothetical protein
MPGDAVNGGTPDGSGTIAPARTHAARLATVFVAWLSASLGFWSVS